MSHISISNSNFYFQYIINLFDQDFNDVLCYSLGINELIIQSSKPPYNIKYFSFSKTLQSTIPSYSLDSAKLSFTTKTIKKISTNVLESLFLTNDGILYSCELSRKTINPQTIPYFNKIKVIDISQCETCTVCYDSLMNIYCWGDISHITGQQPHYSQSPVLLPKELFSFEASLSKVVCGETYVLFLNLTGEAFYCGHIHFCLSNNSIRPNHQSKMKQIDYQGIYDIYGGKSLVAFYDVSNNNVAVFNETIGLIDIPIELYYLNKSSPMKFIDNAVFINAVNNENEPLIIEICFNHISTNFQEEGKDELRYGIKRTYRNEINSLLLWSPYYIHSLAFSNENSNSPSLRVIEEKRIDIVIDIPKRKEIIKEEKQLRKYNTTFIGSNNNKRSYRNSQNTIHFIESSVGQREANNSLKRSSKINRFKEKVFGSVDMTDKVINLNDDLYELKLDRNIEKIKRINKESKSLKNFLYKTDQRNRLRNNSIGEYGQQNNYNTLNETIKGKVYKEIEAIKRFNSNSNLNGFHLNTNGYDNGLIMRTSLKKSNCLIESQHLIINDNEDANLNNKIKRGRHLDSNKTSELSIKQLIALRKRNSNRNLKSKLEEYSDHYFQSHKPFKSSSIIHKNSLIKNSFNALHTDKRITVEADSNTSRKGINSCILKYLKGKKLSKDKKLI